ncbi:ABC transporter permease [Allomuricauda sp. NBRC 101325]|uniref:ABC transporter permease n=1 Tax=Allomuricauda sp. NBRC 101325 TaxID=1113758 RepID=UPI0024A23869|nr:ABC transporter permease [Muricauda sp. NBRC 101325]GLU43304.1 ABC transporter permease [Muricauda sp. NBRC 101325]
MLKKYLISTFRHLQQNKLFTFLNIFGLAIGISVCWSIYRIVSYEYSYDNTLTNREEIYRVITGYVFDEKEDYNGGASKPIYQGIREQLDGFEHVVPVFESSFQNVEVVSKSGAKTSFGEQEHIASVDSAYFKMLPYRWLVGSENSFFDNPNSVVLTETSAKQYFPDSKLEEVLDKEIIYYGYRDTIPKIVVGVVADLEKPSDFGSTAFFSLEYTVYDLNTWTNTNASDRLYLQLKKESNPDAATAQINTVLQQKTKEWRDQSKSTFKFRHWIELMPLKEAHFSTHVGEGNIRKASKPVLFGLLGIALFILLLACINYINMSIASIPKRAKEIGVRKTLGGNKTQLIFHFLLETFIVSFLAAILSVLLIKMGFWLLNDIIPKEISPFSKILEFVVFILAISIFIALLAGLYPSWLITRVNAINVFRNSSLRTKRSHGFNLQKVLIVFQFTIALVFITSSIIIGKQLHYSLKSDMGFNKDAVVLVGIPFKIWLNDKYNGKQFSLYDELKSLSGIQEVSLGIAPMEDGYSSGQYEYAEDGKSPISRQVVKKWVDTSYIHLYDLKLLAGRNLHVSDTPKEYVINETAVKAFGFDSPHDALGKFIGQKDEKLPIVGVVNDFHMLDFYSSIDPMAFQMENRNLRNFNIKLSKNSSEWATTLKEIEEKWSQFYPADSFEHSFYDESIAQLYEQEQQLATLINLTTIIAILISCMGLFGLAVLTAFQRTKEIGIRKVLGSSVNGIVGLLSKEYIVLIVLALIFASPIAWYFMDQWLQKFAYKIEIEWWIFAVAGCIALAIALLTVSSQAIKAAIADPVKSLRTE